jgi:hypothetical protein
MKAIFRVFMVLAILSLPYFSTAQFSIGPSIQYNIKTNSGLGIGARFMWVANDHLRLSMEYTNNLWVNRDNLVPSLIKFNPNDDYILDSKGLLVRTLSEFNINAHITMIKNKRLYFITGLKFYDELKPTDYDGNSNNFILTINSALGINTGLGSEINIGSSSKLLLECKYSLYDSRKFGFIGCISYLFRLDK